MKTFFVLSVLCSASSIAVAAPQLDYATLKTEARRVQSLEGKNQRVSNKILFQMVRLNLSRSDAAGLTFVVAREDDIAFTCKNGLPKTFITGWVTARLEKREAGSLGGTTYELSGCKADTR